jgi:hypothetical protein
MASRSHSVPKGGKLVEAQATAKALIRPEEIWASEMFPDRSLHS